MTNPLFGISPDQQKDLPGYRVSQTTPTQTGAILLCLGILAFAFILVFGVNPGEPRTPYNTAGISQEALLILDRMDANVVLFETALAPPPTETPQPTRIPVFLPTSTVNPNNALPICDHPSTTIGTLCLPIRTQLAPTSTPIPTCTIDFYRSQNVVPCLKPLASPIASPVS